MKPNTILTIAGVTGMLVFRGSWAMSAQDKYTLKIPNGLAFSEFRGYESWQVVSISENGGHIVTILGNPVMIKGYLAGGPGNGKPFPDGAKLAKIHLEPEKDGSVPRGDGSSHPA